MQSAARRDDSRGVQSGTTDPDPVKIDPLLTFMVRRGSTVRVRQRAYLKVLQIGSLLLSVPRTDEHIPDTYLVRATHGDV
jgi:hypothetical protein